MHDRRLGIYEQVGIILSVDVLLLGLAMIGPTLARVELSFSIGLRRITRHAKTGNVVLRRVFGSPTLFSTAEGSVGSSIRRSSSVV